MVIFGWENENSHTAQRQLVEIVEDDKTNPNLKQLEEAFNVETVTKEFFGKYKDLYEKIKKAIEKIINEDNIVQKEFADKVVNTDDFSKNYLTRLFFYIFYKKRLVWCPKR